MRCNIQNTASSNYIRQQSSWQPVSAALTWLGWTFLSADLGFLHWEKHGFRIQGHHPSVSQRENGETPEVPQDRVGIFVAVLHGAEVANQQPGELMQTVT